MFFLSRLNISDGISTDPRESETSELPLRIHGMQRCSSWKGEERRARPWKEICAGRFRVEIKIGFREKIRHLTPRARAADVLKAVKRSRI